MQIGRVVGTLVSTQKHRKLEGAKLLLVQPVALDGTPRGTPLLTIDFDDPTTTVIPIVPPVPPRIISVAWHESRRPSALLDAFVEATLEVCTEVAAGWAADLAA